MLKKITLNNFRCFKNHTIIFKQLNVVVGKNNAGKSTLIEALRIISLIIERYKNINYKVAPNWTGLSIRYMGISPSLTGFDFNFDTVCYLYEQPPAIIEAEFDNKAKVEIYIEPEQNIFAVIYDENGKMIKSKAVAINHDIPLINTLPQLGPLLKEEKIRDSEYVKKLISSTLSSLHFRNQLIYLKEYFSSFKKLSEKTWVGIQINKPEYKNDPLDRDQNISFLVRDGNFSAEVGWMGQGLQMWLQTMWFLARCRNYDTVILDEPDVYLHADLQRRLIRLLNKEYKQVIITTHSLEIISEVEPDNILVIDKAKLESRFATKLDAVQKLINKIGSIQNLHLAKLWSSKKLLIYEGDDIKILKQFQNKIFPNSLEPLDSIPRMSCNGWSGWNYVVGTKMFLKNAGDENINTYCIFDSDYHTEKCILERKKDAESKNVQIHIWKKKEIENYLILPEVIERFILKNCIKNNDLLSKKAIINIINKICDSLRNDVESNTIHEYNIEIGMQYHKEAFNLGKDKVEKYWKDFNSKISIVSGKKILSRLSDWSQKTFGVSFNPLSIAKEMKSEEINEEIKKVIFSIENNIPFED